MAGRCLSTSSDNNIWIGRRINRTIALSRLKNLILWRRRGNDPLFENHKMRRWQNSSVFSGSTLYNSLLFVYDWQNLVVTHNSDTSNSDTIFAQMSLLWKLYKKLTHRRPTCQSLHIKENLTIMSEDSIFLRLDWSFFT